MTRLFNAYRTAPATSGLLNNDLEDKVYANIFIWSRLCSHARFFIHLKSRSDAQHRVAPKSQHQICADSKNTIFALLWPKNPSNQVGKFFFSLLENPIFRKHHFHIVLTGTCNAKNPSSLQSTVSEETKKNLKKLPHLAILVRNCNFWRFFLIFQKPFIIKCYDFLRCVQCIKPLLLSYQNQLF